MFTVVLEGCEPPPRRHIPLELSEHPLDYTASHSRWQPSQSLPREPRIFTYLWPVLQAALHKTENVETLDNHTYCWQSTSVPFGGCCTRERTQYMWSAFSWVHKILHCMKSPFTLLSFFSLDKEKVYIKLQLFQNTSRRRKHFHVKWSVPWGGGILCHSQFYNYI